MEITIPEDCGNSPKNKFAALYSAALLSNDRDTVTSLSTGDIVWINSGGFHALSIKNVLQEMKKTADKKYRSLALTRVFSHGKSAAAEFEFTAEDGGRTRGALFLEFKNGKAELISAVRTYSAS